MFAKEADKIEKYVGGLPDMIYGSVVASKPKTMQEAIEIATELMDKKVLTFAERETASKRKLENTSRTTRNQQQQQQQHSNKRYNTGRVYTTTPGRKKQYGDPNPYALNVIITTMVHVLNARPGVTLPPQKRLDIALGPRYEVGESSSAAARPVGGLREDYGFVATVDIEIVRDQEREVGYGITDSWDEIVETLQGAPTERQLLAGWLNMLFRDRRTHAYTRHLMETEARMSREAWMRATDASDLVHGEVISLRTTVLGQMSEIKVLHAAILELLRIDHRRSTKILELRTALQGKVTALQGQVTALQA
nr:hypothetical protein [Tanacetum cinerariifolium]